MSVLTAHHFHDRVVVGHRFGSLVAGRLEAFDAVGFAIPV